MRRIMNILFVLNVFYFGKNAFLRVYVNTENERCVAAFRGCAFFGVQLMLHTFFVFIHF